MKITTQVTLASADIVSPDIDFAFNGTQINVPRTDISFTSQSITLQFVSGGIIGLTAYQLALKNGFVGTETEWLASLKGADGSKGVNYRGPYNSSNTYAVDDAVTYLGSSYVCVVDGTVGNPIDYPSRWTLFAKKGDDGVPGAVGPDNLYFGTDFPTDALVPSVLVKYSGLTILDIIFRLPNVISLDGTPVSTSSNNIVMSNNNLTATLLSSPSNDVVAYNKSTTVISSGKYYFSFKVSSTSLFSFAVLAGMATANLDLVYFSNITTEFFGVLTGGLVSNVSGFAGDTYYLGEGYIDSQVITVFFDRDNNTWGIIQDGVVYQNMQNNIGIGSSLMGMANGNVSLFLYFILFDNNTDTVTFDLVTTNNTNPALAGYSNMLG